MGTLNRSVPFFTIMVDYTLLIPKLVQGSELNQEAARNTLLQLDEEAVSPLIDEFYAGVNELTGFAILSVLIEIGGYEVRALLEELIEFGVPYPSWQSIIDAGLNAP